MARHPHPLDKAEGQERVAQFDTWRRGDQRAAHKALLLVILRRVSFRPDFADPTCLDIAPGSDMKK
jgi:hypothetical protein